MEPSEGPVRGGLVAYAIFRDPDGRAIIVTEVD